MLGAAQANALSAIFPGAARIVRIVGVRAHAQGAEFVRPGQDLEQVGVLDVRHHGWQGCVIDQAVVAVDGQAFPFLDDQVFADAHHVIVEIDLDGFHADHRGLAWYVRLCW